MKPFFDTNILVYAFLDHEKRERALNVLSNGGLISAQVLNEFTNVALRKFNRSWDDTADAVAIIRMRFPDIVPLTSETHAAAFALTRAHNLSFYDALITAAALMAECDVLMSEDMHHGHRIGSLRVINPFGEDREHQGA